MSKIPTHSLIPTHSFSSKQVYISYISKLVPPIGYISIYAANHFMGREMPFIIYPYLGFIAGAMTGLIHTAFELKKPASDAIFLTETLRNRVKIAKKNNSKKPIPKAAIFKEIAAASLIFGSMGMLTAFFVTLPIMYPQQLRH